MDKVRILLNRLLKGKMTLAVAESCTGGLLADRLTDIPGSSAVFLLGVVTYANSAKTRILRISPTLLKKRGAVSPEVAERMATNVRKIARADVAVAITGIAGPSGGRRAKPVGLVYIAAASKRRVTVRRFLFAGARRQIKRRATDKAIDLLLSILR